MALGFLKFIVDLLFGLVDDMFIELYIVEVDIRL